MKRLKKKLITLAKIQQNLLIDKLDLVAFEKLWFEKYMVIRKAVIEAMNIWAT
jgi:hypothetical protein